MWRAIVLFLIVAAAPANAAPLPWSLDVQPDWTDITADLMKEPELVKLKNQIIAAGGTFVSRAYQTAEDAPALFLVASDNPSVDTMSSYDAFAKSARSGATATAKEAFYREQRGDKLITIVQRLESAEVPAITRRIDGFLRTGGLRTVSINCYGEPAVCDTLITKVTVDETLYEPLDSIEKSEASMTLKGAAIIGGVLGLLILAAVLWNRRRG